MRLYSETIISFIHRLEAELKDIIQNEVRLPVRRTRFQIGQKLYPINIVVFEDPKRLGHFRPSFYEIGINRTLLYRAQDKIIKDILRHELAHYLVWIERGDQSEAHGQDFKELCQRYGWGEEVSHATIDVASENLLLEGDLRSEKLMARLQKLLSLASSDNPHEAEMATLRANQLILQHNLTFFQNEAQEENLYVKSLLTSAKQNAKMSAMYDILQHFMVRPVINKGNGESILEITGTKANVDFAEYLFHYLNQEFDRLWNSQKELKGMRAKNSFFLGLAKGFIQKITFERKKLSDGEQRALMVIGQQLDHKIHWVYPHLGFRQSGAQIDSDSHQRGQQAGSAIKLRRPLSQGHETFLLN